MPVLLELFSGTGSIGKAFRAKGWEVISVDNDPKVECTLRMDVRELTLAHLPKHPDMIWASPVCCMYSRARTYAFTPRDLEWADSLVRAVLNIQAFCHCPALFENPESGLLKTRSIVEHLSYRVVDYCMYHDDRATHKARKRTAIWSIDSPRREWIPARQLCKKDCGFCTGRRHDESAQQGPARPGARRHNRTELYAIPPLLTEEIAEWATLNIFGA
jgi:hypothetical protein